MQVLATDSEYASSEFAAYYGSGDYLDTFALAALDGTGVWAAAGDGARAEAVEKTVLNALLVQVTLAHLNNAMTEAAAGLLTDNDAAHEWDEGWAYYTGGEATADAPYGTADKRARNYGTTIADGVTARVNEEIMAAFVSGLAAMRGSYNAVAAQTAFNSIKQGIRRQIGRASCRERV